ncbi:MAG: transcription-repair coupling factor, partial [Methylovulum sp.]|nr:transcription-repair coupling factor [Methylovulum sp.]
MAHSLIFSPATPQTSAQTLVWSGLTGCADALALATAIAKEKRLLVIITPDNQTALRLEHELAFFLDKQYPILHFPDWETLPYDVFSPLPEITSERLKVLALLPEVKRGALVVPVTTLMHRLAPREHVLANSFAIEVGDDFNLELNRLKLESVGYQCVSQVYQHAEFAVRGAIVDLFPMGSSVPFRIELFDETIESIRTFDPESQRSLEKIERIQLFPAREFPFTDEAIKHFRQAFRDAFPQTSLKNSLYADVSKGMAFNGIEYYLPLFVSQTATLFDYLPTSAVVVVNDSFAAHSQAFYSDAQERYEQRKYDLERPLLTPEQLFLSPDELSGKVSRFARIILDGKTLADSPCKTLPDLTFNAKLDQPAQRLEHFIGAFSGKILLVAESAGRREALLDRLRACRISSKRVDSWQQFLDSEARVCMVVAPVEHSLWLLDPALAIITEPLLSGEK